MLSEGRLRAGAQLKGAERRHREFVRPAEQRVRRQAACRCTAEGPERRHRESALPAQQERALSEGRLCADAGLRATESRAACRAREGAVRRQAECRCTAQGKRCPETGPTALSEGRLRADAGLRGTDAQKLAPQRCQKAGCAPMQGSGGPMPRNWPHSAARAQEILCTGAKPAAELAGAWLRCQTWKPGESKHQARLKQRHRS